MNEEIEDEVNQGRRVGRVDDSKEEKSWRGDARGQPIDVRPYDSFPSSRA